MKSIYILVGVILTFIMIGSLIPNHPLYQLNSGLLTTLIITAAMVLFFGSFERRAVNSKHIAMIATLSSLAAISRVVLAGIAGVQPATFIIMISGYVFGVQTGFMIGALTALVSNFFLGQGPWTPWQMVAWGLCGVLGAWLGRNKSRFATLPFVILCGLSGYIFGAVLNVWHWIAFIYPLNITTFLATYAAAFVFDTLHAVGNLGFAALFGQSFYTYLQRYAKYL